jgi:hypothetical protein
MFETDILEAAILVELAQVTSSPSRRIARFCRWTLRDAGLNTTNTSHP